MYEQNKPRNVACFVLGYTQQWKNLNSF